MSDNTNDGINVTISGDAGRLRSAVDNAKDAVGSFFEKLTDGVKESGEVGEAIAGIFENLRSGSVNDVIEGLKEVKASALAAVGAIYEIGEKLVEFAEKAYELNDAAEDMGRLLGISATEAGELTTRAQLADVSVQSYTGALTMLNRQLKNNEDGLKAMGLETRNSAGELKNSTELMDDAIKVLNEYKAGTDRIQAAQQMFGRGAAESAQLLKLLNVTTEEARQFEEEYGLTLTEQSQAASEEYEKSLHMLSLAKEGLANQVGQVLLPILSDLNDMLRETLPTATVILKGALAGIVSFLEVLENGIVVVWETLKAVVFSIAEPIRAVFAAMARAMVGDFSGAKDKLSGIADQLAARWQMAFDKMAESSAKTAERIRNNFVEGDPSKVENPGSKNFTAPPDANSQGQEKSRFQDWNAVIEQQKASYALMQDAQGTFLQYSKQKEASYWQDILNRDDLTSAERLSVEKSFLAARQALRQQQVAADVDRYREELAAHKNNYDAQLQIAQAAATEMKALYGDDSREYRAAADAVVQIERQKQAQLLALKMQSMDAEKAAALDSIAHAERMARLEVEAGNISKQELKEQLITFENERYQIELNALNARLQLAEQDPSTDPTKLQAAHIAIEALERQHQNKLIEMRREASIASGGFLSSFVNGLAGVWQNGLTSMLNGTLRFSTALRGIWGTIQQQLAQTTIQMGIDWVKKEAMQTAASSAGAAQRLAIEAGAAVKSVAIWAAAGLKNVLISAYQAMAAAWASISAIPVVGPFLAPTVAAATLAGVIAIGSHIASAEGGYDIPAGVNPVTQLHEQEMVLPADIAKPLRQNLADGGSIGGGNINIYAMDAQDVQRVFRKHGPAIMKSLGGQVRNFNTGAG
jgi:hypothetical protein